MRRLDARASIATYRQRNVRRATMGGEDVVVNVSAVVCIGYPRLV